MVNYVSNMNGWHVPSPASCNAEMTPLPPSFQCASTLQRVPYSFVCDFRSDCQDQSDENFCEFPTCKEDQLQCGTSKQCYSIHDACNDQFDCTNNVDEQMCAQTGTGYENYTDPPAIIDVKQNTISYKVFETFMNTSLCPETHFHCPDNGYCLPVFMRCNDVSDCPGREDEDDCAVYDCKGYFRCRSSSVCLHPNHVCDGVVQCPEREDEFMCTNYTCPLGCTCYGLSFTCVQSFLLEEHLELRYLHASHSGLTLEDVSKNTMLVHLGLSNCGLQTIHSVSLPNLHSLDLSHNKLEAITKDMFNQWKILRELSLSKNPLISSSFIGRDENGSLILQSLFLLDMSQVRLQNLDMDTFVIFPNLQILNLSACGIEYLTRQTSNALTKLSVVDLRGSRLLSFPRNVFQHMDRLKTVFADNFKLCCSVNLPSNFDTRNCFAPINVISSCESLLRNTFYRIILTFFAILAVIGNVGSFLFRLSETKSRHSSFGVFVIQLCIADFLMGLYLSMIGVADRLFEGSYLWEDTNWRHSVVCKLAGFLCLVSSEVSATIIYFITLDRFLVLRFPFSHFHFSTFSSYVVCALIWIGGLALATIPLLPFTSHWEFYSQSGTCLPLPVTKTTFPGHTYSFGVMIVLNFILFMLIAVGQSFIYVSVKANTMATADTRRKARDVSIARRLITIAITDFLCWFPIGLCGLLTTQGVTISGIVNVTMAICVLPLNSAINPFLYTVNMMLERRRLRREDALLKRIETAMKETEDE